MDKVKAVINGDRVECGKCGALLAKVSEGVKVVDDWYIKKENMNHLHIKCKHKDAGKTCNTTNEILL